MLLCLVAYFILTPGPSVGEYAYRLENGEDTEYPFCLKFPSTDSEVRFTVDNELYFIHCYLWGNLTIVCLVPLGTMLGLCFCNLADVTRHGHVACPLSLQSLHLCYSLSFPQSCRQGYSRHRLWYLLFRISYRSLRAPKSAFQGRTIESNLKSNAMKYFGLHTAYTIGTQQALKTAKMMKTRQLMFAIAGGVISTTAKTHLFTKDISSGWWWLG